LSVTVAAYRGAPALFVNGKPHDGLMFYSGDLESEIGRKRHRQFVDLDIHPVSKIFNIGPLTLQAPHYDFSPLDAMMDAAIEVDPQALVLPRVCIIPDEKWVEKYPTERMLHFDFNKGTIVTEGCGGGVAFTSKRWREDMEPLLRAYIRHSETKYGENLMGYIIAAGGCGEWSYLWDPPISDYSPAHHQAYREWIRARYRGDLQRLQDAWQDRYITFEKVEVPRDRLRPKDAWSILDPVKNRRIIDYLTFHSDAAAEAILFFCGVTKSELKALDREKICGPFYGYYFWDAGWPCGYHNSGHHALAKVLASPKVDIVISPHDYQECSPGGLYHPQFAAGSLRLNGKLFYNEEDTGTHKVPKETEFYCGRCLDLRTSLGALRRNLMGVMQHNGTQWWMDIYAKGWFDDPDILKEIEGLRRLFNEQLHLGYRPNAEVAVIVNEENSRYVWYDGALTDALIPRQMSELTALGAPFHTFDASDLEKLFASPEGNNYKLVFFMDSVFLSARHRRVIKDLVARKGRTLFWNYAAGLVTEKEISLEAMREMTGIRAGWWDRSWPAKVFTLLTGERITYGTDEYIGPWLYGDDPGAEVLGRMRGKTDRWFVRAPGLLAKDCGKWRSVWSAAPTIQAPVLRAIAARAGVHLYRRTGGDQVLAARNLLGLHAAEDGERTLYLPRRATVTDAITGKLVAKNAAEFKVKLQLGDTALWRLSSTGK
jgi:hypothetical protein